MQLAADLSYALDPTKVIRNTAAGTVLYNGVNVGQIVGFNTTYINNARLETAGIDFGINHSLERFRPVRCAEPLAAGDLSDRLRDQRRGRGGSRNPAWQAPRSPCRGAPPCVTSGRWVETRVQSLLRFTDSYANDATPNAGTFAKPFVESYLVWDLSYSYAIGELFGLRSSHVSLGVNNVMNKNPPWVPDVNHLLATMYDYSGRAHLGAVEGELLGHAEASTTSL